MESTDDSLKEEELEGVAGIIKFILILDNSGKRIYCNYYTRDYPTIESQLDFELRLSKITSTYSVERDNTDIFAFENFTVVCKIDKEIAIFIGQDENDNEILLEQFFQIFETQLFNFIGGDLSRTKILNKYNEIVMLIDELVSNGLVLNIDEHSVYNRIKNCENKKEINVKNIASGGFMSGLFGYFSGKSNNNQTPNEQRKEEQESSNIFKGLMSNAKGYLKKNIE